MDIELGEVQLKFAELVWREEPISSGDLVKLCNKEFEWKKSTTYTVIKKMCEKGLFKNQDGLVTSIVSREEFYQKKTEAFLDDTFSGSLPAFLAAFTTRKKLSKKEVEEIQKIIDKAK